MRLVILESPYAGNVDLNVRYARRCVHDSLRRGEAPIASHLLYTQPGILDDTIETERNWGIAAGLAWRGVAQASVIYTDLGISKGMGYGITRAQEEGIPIEFRKLEGWDEVAERRKMGDHAATTAKSVNINGWHVARTLLGSNPDCNQRNVYHGSRRILEFNHEMRTWPAGLDAKLDEVCRLLNEVEESLNAKKLD